MIPQHVMAELKPESLNLVSNIDFTQFFLIESTVLADEEVPANSAEKANLEVVMIINGVQVPFRKTIEYVESRMDEMVLAKAKELIKEKMSELDDLTSQVRSLTERIVSDVESKYRNKI